MDPGRRPYWFDVQTCEQNFGVLRFEPVSEHAILIDGEADDWKGIGPLMNSDSVYNVYSDGYDEGRDLKGLYAWSDAAYLYLRIDYADLFGPPNWEAMNTLVLLDTVPGQGITHVPFGTDLVSARGIDFMVHLNGSGSRVLVDSYYDANYYDYAVEEGLLPLEPYMNRSDNGVFHRIELTTSRGFTVWPTREVHPFQSYETGALRWGISDRDDYNFDPLADVYAGDECIEMRLPWLMLNFRDPSRKIVLPDLWKEGLHSGLKVEGIYLAAATFKPGSAGASVEGENSPPIADSMPLVRNGVLQEADFGLYTWDDWSVPQYREVLKESYHIMQEEYGGH
jgi:hypothetical protein